MRRRIHACHKRSVDVRHLCMEEDTCMSYEEEDACMSPRSLAPASPAGSKVAV
jgi:hypothetical protein